MGLSGWLRLSSAKVYVGVKQDIAETRIPALNAYMKVRPRGAAGRGWPADRPSGN